MLTNYEYPEQILAQAKKVALICVEEIINALSEHAYKVALADYELANDMIDPTIFWDEVKTEIEKL